MKKRVLIFITGFFISVLGFGNVPLSELISILEQKKKIDPPAALFYADSLLTQVSLPDSVTAEIHYQKALIFSYVNDAQNTLKSIKLALPYFTFQKHPSKFISVLLIQATANIYLNNFSLASAQTMEALSSAQQISNIAFICKSYDTLSHIYYSLKDYEKSIKYLLEAATLQAQIKDTVGLSASYNNIAIVYKNMLQNDKALAYNYKSLRINEQQKDYRSIAKSYNNIGGTLQNMARYEEAMDNYKKAIRINEQYEVPNSTPQRSMASCFVLLGQYDEAEKYLEAALEIEKTTGNIPVIQELYDKLLSTTLEQKKYEQAIQYFYKRDSLGKIQMKQEQQEKLQLLANQQKILKQEQELAVTKAAIQKRILLLGLLFGVVVFLMILFYLRSQNKQLQSQQKQLRLEQKVLRSQMNPHFIFNVMTAIQNTLLENNPLRSASLLSVFARLMRQNFEVANKEFITLKEELSALEDYIQIQQLRFQYSFTYKIVVDPSIMVHKIQIPPLLLQPFIENSIEHGLRPVERVGNLEIILKKINSGIEFKILDNGVGYQPLSGEGKSEHAIEIFCKRLQLREKGEERSFSILKRISQPGTEVKFILAL